MFCYSQKAYSVETKLACIEMKKAGKSNKVIMDTLSIKMLVRPRTGCDGIRMMDVPFPPTRGKQYTYGNGMKQLSEVEQLRLQVELLKSIRA